MMAGKFVNKPISKRLTFLEEQRAKEQGGSEQIHGKLALIFLPLNNEISSPRFKLGVTQTNH